MLSRRGTLVRSRGFAGQVIAEIRAILLKEMPKIIDLFRSFDRNGDGTIDLLEFAALATVFDAWRMWR